MFKNFKIIVVSIFIIVVLLIINFGVYVLYKSVISHKRYSEFKASYASTLKTANVLLKTNFYELQGELCSDFGRYKQSIKYYDKVLNLSPDFTVTYKFRAEAKKAIGDIDGAKLDYSMYEKISGKVKKTNE